MAIVVGIDLGTSNTCAASFHKGRSELIHNRLGARTTPSAVLFHEDGTVAVGASARRKAVMAPERTVLGAKRLIGRAYDSPEVRTLLPVFAYKVIAAPNGDAWAEIDGRGISPVEVLAHVLADVRGSIEQFYSQSEIDAVITVPAFFDETQRQATRDAAEIAGISARRIITEPTAAALAYGYAQNDRRNVVVFDLGGGTFDVTVIAIERGRFDVLATDGDMLLGGGDFDRELLLRFAEDIRETKGFDPLEDLMSRQRLVLEAERVKQELTAFKFVDSSMQYLTDGRVNPTNWQKRTTRQEFDQLTAGLVDKLAGPCLRALEESGIELDQIDEVLAVGGMTRCPAVQQKVIDLFGRAPLARVNPDEAVALGASVQAGIMNGELPKATVVDVAPRGLGLKTAEDSVSTLIEKSAPLPVSVTKTFKATDDRKLSLEILQGESSVASENRRLGWVELPSFQPKAGAAYRVTFSVSEEGLLSAEAEEVETGERHKAEVRPSSGLSPTMVERLKEEFATVRRKKDTRSVNLTFS